MKFLFIDGDGNKYTGSILFQYTSRENGEELDCFIVKTDTGELVHLSCSCLVGEAVETPAE